MFSSKEKLYNTTCREYINHKKRLTPHVLKTLFKYCFNAVILINLLSSHTVFAQYSKVDKFKITILSTNLVDYGLAESGFSALIEVDGRKLLFDTGLYPKTVISNSKNLDINLKGIQEIAISHNHGDHTGGLIKLKEIFNDSDTFSTVHVGDGIFLDRSRMNNNRETTILKAKRVLSNMGVEFKIHSKPFEIWPGVWLSGPIPRISGEMNGSKGKMYYTDDNIAKEDDIPEYQALFILSKEGMTILTSCGHAGIINTIKYAHKLFGNSPIHAIIGGLHLSKKNREEVIQTAQKLKEFSVKNFIGAHCTGIYPTWIIKETLNLNRKNCIVGSVGTIFDSTNGISSPPISK